MLWKLLVSSADHNEYRGFSVTLVTGVCIGMQTATFIKYAQDMHTHTQTLIDMVRDQSKKL